jgi:hypothetical protein
LRAGEGDSAPSRKRDITARAIAFAFASGWGGNGALSGQPPSPQSGRAPAPQERFAFARASCDHDSAPSATANTGFLEDYQARFGAGATERQTSDVGQGTDNSFDAEMGSVHWAPTIWTGVSLDESRRRRLNKEAVFNDSKCYESRIEGPGRTEQQLTNSWLRFGRHCVRVNPFCHYYYRCDYCRQAESRSES